MSIKNRLHGWYERYFGVQILSNDEYRRLTGLARERDIAASALKDIACEDVQGDDAARLADGALRDIGFRKFITHESLPPDCIYMLPKGITIPGGKATYL